MVTVGFAPLSPGRGPCCRPVCQSRLAVSAHLWRRVNLRISIIFVKLMDMLTYVSPGPVPVVHPLATGTASSRFGSQSARWSSQELLALVRWSAAQLGAPAQLPEPVNGGRSYELLERTHNYELWVIRWSQDTGLALHDHGGAGGAFYVTEGRLEETSATAPGNRLRRRSLVRGEGKAFGAEYVHSVANPQVAPATSVHAYSPPLASMTFYSRSSSGLVVSHVETAWVGAP